MSHKSKNLIVIVFILLLAISSTLLSADPNWKEHSYLAQNIIDGDTFEATDGNLTFRVRIAGMDTPEYKQPYGKQSTHYLRKLIEGKQIQIHPVGKGRDRYNRILGQVYLEGKDISVLMIEAGHATYYRPKCVDYPFNKQFYNYDPRKYIEAEKLARREKRGLWSQLNPVLPCRFRKKYKSTYK